MVRRSYKSHVEGRGVGRAIVSPPPRNGRSRSQRKRITKKSSVIPTACSFRWFWRRVKRATKEIRARSSRDTDLRTTKQREASERLAAFSIRSNGFWGGSKYHLRSTFVSFIYCLYFIARDAIRKLPPIGRMADCNIHSLDISCLSPSWAFEQTRTDKPRFPSVVSPPTFYSIGACSFLRTRYTTSPATRIPLTRKDRRERKKSKREKQIQKRTYICSIDSRVRGNVRNDRFV